MADPRPRVERVTDLDRRQEAGRRWSLVHLTLVVGEPTIDDDGSGVVHIEA